MQRRRAHKHDLLYAVGDDEEYKPKNLVPEILQAAYYTGYGKLLDLLESEKWITLKKIKPRKQPICNTPRTHVLACIFLQRILCKNTIQRPRRSRKADKRPGRHRPTGKSAHVAVSGTWSVLFCRIRSNIRPKTSRKQSRTALCTQPNSTKIQKKALKAT